MKLALKPHSAQRVAHQAGFTLAEVLAALLFMAIVIPVAVQGLRVASMAGEVADRKSQAMRVAERLLNESMITTNWNKAMQSGVYIEGFREFRWTMRNEKWPMDGNMYAPNLLTVEVGFPVQGNNYLVRLSTLTANPQL